MCGYIIENCRLLQHNDTALSWHITNSSQLCLQQATELCKTISTQRGSGHETNIAATKNTKMCHNLGYKSNLFWAHQILQRSCWGWDSYMLHCVCYCHPHFQWWVPRTSTHLNNDNMLPWWGLPVTMARATCYFGYQENIRLNKKPNWSLRASQR